MFSLPYCMLIPNLGGDLPVWFAILQSMLLQETVKGNASYSIRATGRWRPLLVSLPTRQGLHQVVIRATRSPVSSDIGDRTGVVIDDLSVRYCSDYSKYSAATSSVGNETWHHGYHKIILRLVP